MPIMQWPTLHGCSLFKSITYSHLLQAGSRACLSPPPSILHQVSPSCAVSSRLGYRRLGAFHCSVSYTAGPGLGALELVLVAVLAVPLCHMAAASATCSARSTEVALSGEGDDWGMGLEVAGAEAGADAAGEGTGAGGVPAGKRACK